MATREDHYRNLYLEGIALLQESEDNVSDYFDALLEFFIDNGSRIDTHSFEELLKKSQNIDFSIFSIDKISNILLPPDAKKLFPIKCSADGNCLYNSISVLIIGTEELNLELRLKAVQEIIMNRLYYGKELFEKYSGANNFEEEVVSSIKSGTYSSLRHIAALANVLNVKIRSIYPAIISPYVNRHELNQVFTPKSESSYNFEYAVMWTHLSNTVRNDWRPNHFVPCVAKSDTTGTVPKKRKAEANIASFFKVTAKKCEEVMEKKEVEKKEVGKNEVEKKEMEKKKAEVENKKEFLNVKDDGQFRKINEENKGKRKNAGSIKYASKFNPAWTKARPYIQPAKGDIHAFLCTICSKKVSCSHQAIGDVNRHCSSREHLNFQKGLNDQAKLPKHNKETKDKITTAELKMALTIIKHNAPFTMADTLSPLINEVFSDSKTGSAYASRSTKTMCLINGALKPYFKSKLINTMQNGPYALGTDGSNDEGLVKMNPLVVHVFDESKGKIASQLLDMGTTKSSTAESLFNNIDKILQSVGVSWDNCVGVGLDNTAVNLGKRNSIMTRVLKKNPNAYINGCPCHIIHNTAQKAAESFGKESHFDIEDLLVDLFYWFDKSSKRKVQLEDFCQFCDQEYRKIIKYVSTRWLSLEAAVERALKLYPSLKSYFLSGGDCSARFQRLVVRFNDPMTQVYLMFYQSACQLFIKHNLLLQREEPLIPKLHDQLQRFMRSLGCKFLKVDAVADKGPADVDYQNRTNQKDDNHLEIGFLTRSTLNKLFTDVEIGQREKDAFFNAVRSFYERAYGYALANLPLDDRLIKEASVVNWESRRTINDASTSIGYFVNRFPNLLPFQLPKEFDELMEEYHDYQFLSESDISPEDLKKIKGDKSDKKIKDDKSDCLMLDRLWNHLGGLKTAAGMPRFPRLNKVARLILTIPHSNAEEERVFSIVRKNKTCFRSSLGIEDTLGSLITCKLAMEGESVTKMKIPDEVLNSARKATTLYNEKHSTK